MQRWLPQKFSNIPMVPFVVERWNSRGAYREMDVPAFLRISLDLNRESWDGGNGVVLQLRL